MISSIHSTSIFVSDQNAAVDFYVNKLGWAIAIDFPMGEGKRFVTVVPPGATTQLALNPQAWIEGQHASIGSVPGFAPNSPKTVPGTDTPVRASGISLSTPDIDATYETLISRGVAFKGPIESMPWGGRATWFYDIDGHEFFLVGQ